jgi:G:T-mismatch repair DNA endonuclease (very short patch repair protein)
MMYPRGRLDIIHNELSKLGVKFDAEHLINGKFCVDVFAPEYNLIIFVDGCYWHACPIHHPNNKKPNSDNARIPYLTKCGYNIEIIWEHDIKERLDEVIKGICLKYKIQNLAVS